MALSVNTNVNSLGATLNLDRSGARLAKSLERLSSGLRINQAADDASGLVISELQRSQINGLDQATENIDRAVTLTQTAESGLAEINELLLDLRELAVDSANQVVHDTDSFAANESEKDNLLDTITRISDTTKFGTVNVLNGNLGATAATATASTGDFTFAATTESITFELNNSGFSHTITVAELGLTAATHTASAVRDAFNTEFAARGLDDEITASLNGDGALVLTSSDVGTAAEIDITAATTSGGTGLDRFTVAVNAGTGTEKIFQIGAFQGETSSINISNVDSTALSISAIAVDTQASAAAAITTIDAAISTVSVLRGNLGAFQENTLRATQSNLQTQVNNLREANSITRDTNFTTEITNFTNEQIRQQAATSILGLANQSAQSILSLLQ